MEEKKTCDNNCATCNQTSWLHCALMFTKVALERLERIEDRLNAPAAEPPVNGGKKEPGIKEENYV